MRYCVCFILLTLLSGCDIFTLRESEEPDKPPLWNSFFTTTELAVENLEYSYEDERNAAKYSDLFMPNFRFHFATQDINDYNINLTWTREVERDMLYNLHNLIEEVAIDSLNPIPGQADDLNATPARLYRQYQISLTHSGQTTVYAGKMELQMVQDNGFWRILNWYDYRSDPLPQQTLKPTWGKLKYDHAV